MKKRSKLLALILSWVMAISVFYGASAETISYESTNRAFKLDTASYTMAPGDIYDFRVTLKGDLAQQDVKVSDSRTGSVVKLTRIPNTDKYRITAVKEGTSYVVVQVGNAHLSFQVNVTKGTRQGGVATHSNYAVVPDDYKPVSNSSQTNKSGITIVEVTKNTVMAGETATLTIKGKPNTKYTIGVYYTTKKSEAKGLESKISDAAGYVTWTWEVGGNTKPGTHSIEITGGGETIKTKFTTG